MAAILVADSDPIYSELTEAILSRAEFEYEVIRDSASVTSHLRSGLYDVLLLDLNIARSDSDLLEKLNEFPDLSVILTSEEDIDRYFDLVVNHHINLVLGKPMKSQELVNVIERLRNVDRSYWFGIENYMRDIAWLKRIEITNSTQIRTSIKSIFEIIEEKGYNFDMRFEMDLVWQEILVNAVYHSHGYSEEKKQRKAIRLPADYRVDLRFGGNRDQFGISIRDYRGTLSPRRIIQSLETAVKQQNMIQEAYSSGEDISATVLDRGRGLDLIRRMTGEYYFVIDPGRSTEVIIIYDRNFEKDDPISSIKIFELPHRS